MEWTAEHQRLYDASLADPQINAWLNDQARQIRVQAKLSDPVDRMKTRNPAQHDRLMREAEQVVVAQEHARERRAQERRQQAIALAEARQWAEEFRQMSADGRNR